MTLRHSLLQFVREQLATGADAASIGEDEPLIDRGIIDSMALMRLITFVEERTGVRIPDDEVVPDNFQTVTSIESLVRRLQARS
jgi:acyl carrier protein